MPRMTRRKYAHKLHRSDLKCLDQYEGQRLRFEGKVMYEEKEGVWLISDLAIMQFKDLGRGRRIRDGCIPLGVKSIGIRSHHLIRGERIAFNARVNDRRLLYVTGIWQPDDYDRPTR